MSERVTLDLSSLHEGVELTNALVETFREAARVMLDEYHNADDPLDMLIIDNGSENRAALIWQSPTRQMRESHDNKLDATEYGAYAVAFATVHAVDGYVIKKRAHHGSGSDFLMVEQGQPDEEFVCLEISGVGEGEGRMPGRLRTKVSQLQAGDLRRPGVAAVVGFEAAKVLLEDCPL